MVGGYYLCLKLICRIKGHKIIWLYHNDLEPEAIKCTRCNFEEEKTEQWFLEQLRARYGS